MFIRRVCSLMFVVFPCVVIVRHQWLFAHVYNTLSDAIASTVVYCILHLSVVYIHTTRCLVQYHQPFTVAMFVLLSQQCSYCIAFAWIRTKWHFTVVVYSLLLSRRCNSTDLVQLDYDQVYRMHELRSVCSCLLCILCCVIAMHNVHVNM